MTSTPSLGLCAPQATVDRKGERKRHRNHTGRVWRGQVSVCLCLLIYLCGGGGGGSDFFVISTIFQCAMSKGTFCMSTHAISMQCLKRPPPSSSCKQPQMPPYINHIAAPRPITISRAGPNPTSSTSSSTL